MAVPRLRRLQTDLELCWRLVEDVEDVEDAFGPVVLQWNLLSKFFAEAFWAAKALAGVKGVSEDDMLPGWAKKRDGFESHLHSSTEKSEKHHPRKQKLFMT